MRILVVEDERRLAEGIKRGLEKNGYAVDVIEDGGHALRRLFVHREDYDLVILDLMLPSVSGLDVCKQLREADVVLPILILTARAEVENKVNLLQAGADDYLVKPFSFDELLARVAALLRRPREKISEVMKVGAITLDPAAHTVLIEGEPLELTLKEFMLLEYFMRHPDVAINREELLTHLWDFNYESFSNVVDVHVKNLRRKLAEHDQDVLETVRGIGYKFRS